MTRFFLKLYETKFCKGKIPAFKKSLPLQMVGVAGFEPTGLSENQAQNFKNSNDAAHIEAQEKSPDPDDSDLCSLIKCWPDLSEHDKQIIIMIARKGGDL